MPTQTKTKDIFELLEQDHREIRQLLTRVADKEDYQAFPALAAEINAHVEAEEQAFYQPLQDRNEQELHETVLEGFEEHHVGELVMRELDRNNRGSERWHAKAMVFKEIIEHHLDEEEGRLFPEARAIIKDGQAEAMGEEFARLKARTERFLLRR